MSTYPALAIAFKGSQMTLIALLPTTVGHSSISGIDLINLFSAATSIVLAIVAVFLSIFFFVQSKNDAQRSARSAEEISTNVSRLEKVFDSFHNDTFGILRDTVTDMREHVWRVAYPPSPNENELTKQGESDVQASLLEEISRISKNVGITDSKIEQLSSELKPALVTGLEAQGEAALAGVREESSEILQKYILGRIRRHPSTPEEISRSFGAPLDMVMDVAVKLNSSKELQWTGSPDVLRSTSILFAS